MLDRVTTSATRCTVVPSIVSDAYRLAANLRQADRDEVESLGLDPRSAIRRCFRDGILRKTYFIDGEIAAMSGLCGPMLGDIGEPYLMTTPVAERMPLMFLRQAKASVAEMLQHKLRLEGHVKADYHKACRLLTVLGFDLGKPEPFGSHGALFRKFVLMRGS